MKNTHYRWGTGLLLAVWMAVIFLFSAQPDTESAEVSGTVAYRIVDVADHVFQMEMTGTERQQYVKKLDYPVRKAAHMSEYAILALLSLAFFKSMEMRGRKMYLPAFLLAVLYAGTDEFHQLCVSGRAGRFSDVCIDAAGALIALLLAYAIGRTSVGRATAAKIAGKRCEKQALPLQ